MYRKIVVGYDGSDQAKDALALASTLRGADGVVIAACVYLATGPVKGAQLEPALAEAADEALAEARSQIDADWLSVQAARGQSPAHGLHVLTEDAAADLVVVGSSHRGDARRVLSGSTGDRLLNGSPCPVAVAPKGFAVDARPPGVIGVAFDGSDEAASALREGAALAGELEATLRLLTVVPPLGLFSDAARDHPTESEAEIEHYRHEEFRRRLEDAAGQLPDELRAATVLRDGRPTDEIVEEAASGIDLLVMGSRNYGPIRRVMVGSTAIAVMRRAPCPVVVIPRGVEAERGRTATAATSA